MCFFESVPVLTLFRPRCVWSKGKAMGQSVQLLMVTLRPGSERRGWGRGSGCWKGTAGDAVDGKGCPGTPAGSPPQGRTGVRGGWQTGLGTHSRLRALAAGRDGSLELSQGRVGDPQELHRGPGGMAGRASSATHCPAAEKG